MKKTYSYIETRPETTFLVDAVYKTCSLHIGRPCLDVILLVEGSLILAKRSVEPVAKLWPVGGRIRWEHFNDPYQYATRTAQQHLRIDITNCTKHLLQPRFICFSERPYPEVLVWIVVEVSKKLYGEITLDTTEQSQLLEFSSKRQFLEFIKESNLSSTHQEIMTELWDELVDKEILKK